MSQDRLGLFDTPPDRQQVRLSLALIGLLFVAFVILSTLPDIRLREIDSFIPMADAIMFLGDMITATLLYVQASVFRSRALTVLASGYLFTALMLIAHVLSFPGAFAPDGLLGAKVSTTAWIATFWRSGPPIAIILYTLLKRADFAAPPEADRPAPRITMGVLAAIALAAALTTLATRGHDLLPALFVDRYKLNPNLFRLNCGLIGVQVVAIALLFPNRKSVLDMWLLVALWGWLAHALLNLSSWSRFTVSFYSQFTMLLFSHFIVMLALIAETNRLYARLALATAARNRAHETRLMSMEAVTAAISHEVGQPLTAVTTNASAALNWLGRTPPNAETDMAMEALRATIEAGHLSQAVIKSIRATFAKGPRPAAPYSLNDLVRETIALLDRELADKKVALELKLDAALPPIRADRVQMQRVLFNLVTNAIESLGTVQERRRRIAIRSGLLDGQDVLVEISDSGAGIGAEHMTRIFDAFYTTKATGTGLGLSLCRTIVEENGGRLWASEGERYGATFHLRLPRSDCPHTGDIAAHA